MGISLLKSILSSVNGFFQLSVCESTKVQPLQNYYLKTGEILNILNPIFDAVIENEIASHEMLERAFEELLQSVDELKEIFENWQPLMSKVYFVPQIESLVPKVRDIGLEILNLLKSSDNGLHAELSAASLELCVEEINHIGYKQISLIILKAIKDQMEGSEANSESFAVISDALGLKSNQDLLIEILALEKLKETAEQAENEDEVEDVNKMIALVTHMHDLHIKVKQCHNCSPVPIPPDFCCPLSLELMRDPVIVASGQTYERAFIEKWMDLGLTVCPKTGKSLARTNLIPNYTVKALIEHWCETNNVKLPDLKPVDLHDASCTLDRSFSSPVISSFINKPSPLHTPSFSEVSLEEAVRNANGLFASTRSTGDMTDHSGESNLNSDGLLVTSQSRNSSDGGHEHHLHNEINSASKVSRGTAADGNDQASGELTADAANLSSPQRASDFPIIVESRLHGRAISQRPSERFVQRSLYSQTVETSADLLQVETQVKRLVEDLKCSSLDAQRNATSEIRLLAKHNMDNRIIIAQCGAISTLVNLLRHPDLIVQENSATALLNLSINDNNKSTIANAGAIEHMIHVLETGTPEAKENSAATLFSLSVMEENKVKIGRAGAIRPLVELLGKGTPRGKRDAINALFNLSANHENKTRIVQSGAVKYLVELMTDPTFGLVNKAVAVLSNLSSIQEGRVAIGQGGGIPALVEVVELGSARSKENAAAALLNLCTNSGRFCRMVLQEGVIPPLVALSHSGTPRGKEKAQQLVTYFKNQRRGTPGRP